MQKAQGPLVGRTVRKRFASANVLLAVFLCVLTGVFLYTRGGTYAAASSTLNFQARLLSNTGQTVTDGSYNVEFNLYTTATGGTSQWTETRLVSAAQGVTVKNGYFSVNLGEITAFPNTIAWDQEQWLGMTVRGTGSCSFGACTPTDAEMTPRFKLTAVPFAFRAGALMNAGGTTAFTADDLVQKAPSSVQAINLAVAAIRLNQSGAGGLLQLQGSGTDVFTVANSGATTIKGDVLAKTTTNSAAAFDVQDSSGNSFLKIDTFGAQATFGATASSQTVLQAGTGGVRINSGANVSVGAVDATGTLFVVDTKNTAGDPTGTDGAIYYNSVLQKFRCYENGAWTDCIAGGSYDGTSASFMGGLQNVPANGTGLAIENMVFTSATAVSNVAASGAFTAPASGSFRSCLVMNNAAITAGTISLRWRVNGVSVGSPVCTMTTGVTSRQASSVLNPDVVTFNAGDLIDLAFDTSNNFAPAGSNDFTVYWNVEYTGTAGSSAGDSLQDVYDQSVAATIQTTNNKDITFSLADTAIDSDFVVDIASGSDSRFVLQNAGSETFSISKDGSIATSNGITLGTSSSTTAGTIRWTGTDFEGFDGATWVSLTSGGGSGSGGTNFVNVIKTVNEVVNGSAALQDDDALTFPIGPNESWTYNFVIQANTPATPDLQFAVSAPAGATCRYGYNDAEQAISAAQFACGATTGLINGDGLNNMYEISGTVQNGPTAGNVTLRWAQNTANASNTIVYAGSYVQAVRVVGAGGNGQPFAQNGNSFGTLAVLGTSDNNSLSVITNNIERIRVLAAGDVRFSDDIIANGSATGVTGTTSGPPGTNTTSVQLSAAGSFANNDVIYINNAGQDYYTRIVSGAGTTTLTVSPAVSYDTGATVTVYTVQNIGATTADYATQANRFFQGYFLGGVTVGAGSTTLSDGNLSRTTGDIVVTPGTGGVLRVLGTIDATAIVGDGSGITNLDGSAISVGSISDSSLSSNVPLLNTSSIFSALQTFGGGITLSAGQTLTVSGDAITDFTGTGLQLVGGVLETTLGTSVDLSSEVTSTLPITSGGTGATSAQTAINSLSGLTTAGDILYSDGTNTTRLPRGTNGQCLTSTTGGIAWGSCTTGAVTTIGTIDSQTKVADGAVIAGGSLVLQTADGTNPGLVSATTQTFGGDKTFNGQVIGTGGFTLTGTGLLNTTGTAATSIGNATGAVTITGSNGSSFVIGGTTISAAEFSLLDGRNAALVDTNDAVNTAITGTGALTSGSIGGSFGNINIGTNTFTGNGSGLSSLNGSNLNTGTVADARLSTNVTLQGNTFNGSSQLVQLNASSQLPAVSGINLTNLNGSNIASGTVADARLSTNVTLQGNTFNGASQLVQLNASSQLPAVSGANVTNLNGSNIASGTVVNARLTNAGALTVTAGTGLTGGGSVALGGSTTLNVSYGSAAGTAAQGNVTFTCPSGTGNLSGGGTTITIGTGGTCANLSVINNPTFSGLITGQAGLTVTGAAVSLNDTSNFATNINTGTSNGTVTIGGGNAPLVINSTAFDVSSTGAVSGVTTLTTSSTITLGGLGTTDSGNILCRNTTNVIALCNALTDAQVSDTLTSSQFVGSGSATTAVDLGTAEVAGTLTIARGGTGVGTTPTNGQLLIGNGTGYTLAGLTNNGGVIITNGAGSISLAVAYGSTANTAVQGNTTLICPSGSGNLTGGGNTITIGAGGTCGAISTNNAVSFTTSVTTPTLTSTAALAISSGGTSSLSFNSASNILVIDATDTTLQRTAAGDFTIDLADTAATNLVLTNSAAGAASLNLADGNLLTGGTARLTNGGVLQNIAGLTITSGGASIAGASSFADTINLNGNVVIGDANTDRLTINSQLSGANALVFQGATDNAFVTTIAIADPTANNTITLPNTSGTILLLGAAAIQTDASTNASIGINKTGATGNILTLQKSGTGVFTIANDGSTTIQLNSTAVFNIRNSAGTDQFTIDSTNSLVRIGSATTDGVGTLLILDSKNTAGDPAIGANTNAQYYNSFNGAMRCYEGGIWSDCSSTRLLGETTLGAASNTISVTIPTGMEYIKCRVDIKGRSANSGVYLRFNGDAGAASYGWNEYDIINAAVGDAQDNSDSEIQLTGTDTTNIPASASLEITNFADMQKIVDWSYAGVTAIGTNNRHYNGTGNWANATTQINTVTFLTSAGTFNIGSHAWCEGRNIR